MNEELIYTLPIFLLKIYLSVVLGVMYVRLSMSNEFAKLDSDMGYLAYFCHRGLIQSD